MRKERIMNQVAERLISQVPVSLSEQNREVVRDYFTNSWDIYEVLFSAIHSDESYYESPDPLRNPLIFYYGHTAAFYINKLVMAGLLEKGIDAHYEELFAKGVDPDLPENLEVADVWPAVDEVCRYRQEVFSLVMQVIEEADFSEPIHPKNPLWSLHMGIEHDRIHFETSSVLIRQLDASKLSKPESWEYAPTDGEPERNVWIGIPEGQVQLGRSEDYDWFSWDNEFGSKQVNVSSFAVSKNLITNSEYLDFVLTAYNDQTFWTNEGWEWKERVGSVQPKFWIQDGDTYQYRAMFDVIDMPKDWPVEVNAHEAIAYLNWLGDGSRLLTEAEFRLLERRTFGGEPIHSESANINMRFGSPTPVGMLNRGEEVNDLYGNVWDWLSDDFYPLPGFEVHPYYEDFSAPYFDDEHSMMLGASWSTTGTGASKYYRLWFRRNFYQHAGFRLAKDIK